MAEKSFILLSLKENKTKKLTQTLSNEKARQILEFLSGKEFATETQVAKELNIPISTVHYNLKLLKENKLVTEKEYHYSDKGKEVIHYKIANKYIIIAPTEDDSILDKIKHLLPAVAIFGATALTIFLVKLFNSGSNVLTERSMVATPLAAKSLAIATDTAPVAGAQTTAQNFVPIAAPILIEPIIWFIAGGLFILIVIVILEILKRKSNK